jgi:flagellar hook-associated protein 3 FlgL
MSITGPGSVTATTAALQNTMMNQLNTLAQELGTGKAAQTYSDLQAQSGVSVELNAQLSALNGYSSTANTVNTTLSTAQSVLGEISQASATVQSSVADQPAFSLNSSGQTQVQSTSASYLDQVLSLLNTQVGSNFIFSGSGVDQQSVVNASTLLNGSGSQAGLIQIVSERGQADLGTTGTGHLTTSIAGSTVTLNQDNTPFGFKLNSVNSSLTGATVTGPTGSPASISVALGSNPNDGDTIQFQLTLPDGSTQNISLQATTSSTPSAGQFTIGTTTAATAANLQTALNSSITTLAQTALPAASAMEAGNNFFANPPQIVVPGAGNNYAAATTMTNGTSANTVIWYTGASSATPARQTQSATVAPGMTIDYGLQANEQAMTNIVKNIAVLASTTYSATNTNAQASYQALTGEVYTNLTPASGSQSIDDMEADIANAQNTVTNATTLNTQTQTTIGNLLNNIDGVNQTNVSEQILTLQNSLSASMSVTARLAQLSLVNYLSAVSG